MAPKIPSIIQCSSATLLEYELREVREGLDLVETEDSWDKITNAIMRLKAITIGSAEDYPSELIAACKGVVRPIINSLTSDRSRLSGAATDLVTALATHLQRPFELLIPHLVPTLLTLSSRSNKIFVARAKACLMAIVEYCASPAIIPLLRHSVSDKSVTLRLTVIEVLVACLNKYNPPDLETPARVDDIETVIKALGRDPNSEIRKTSRKAFEAYKLLFPARVDAFVAPLTPTMRKYLDVKNAAANQSKPLHSSSSAVSSTAPSSSRQPDVLARSQPVLRTSARSATTTTVSVAEPAPTFTRVERVTRAAAKPSSSSVAAATTAAADVALMPPPPPPQEKKSSSGPIRPPLEVRQALAAAGKGPIRPKLGRHASRPNLQTSGTMAPDLTRSQPSVRTGPQRPEKAPTPPLLPSTTGVQPVSSSSEAGPSRTRSTRRQLADILKQPIKGSNREAERAAAAPSASSSTSVHTDVHTRSRPPSRLASAEDNDAEKEMLARRKEAAMKEKRREEERETRKRTMSRPEPTFRPASRAEVGSHKRSGSREQELHIRPASRMETRQPPPNMEAEPIFSRPKSRSEKAPARPEHHDEMVTAEKSRKRRAEQPPAQPPQVEGQRTATTSADAELMAKEERRRRRALRAAQAAEAADALTRAPSKRSKVERVEDNPPKKRREETADGELRMREGRLREREGGPPIDAEVLVAPAMSESAKIMPKAGVERGLSNDVPHLGQASGEAKTNKTDAINDSGESSKDGSTGGGKKLPDEPITRCPVDAAEPRTPPKAEKTRPERRRECVGVRPLVIRKASVDGEPRVNSEADTARVAESDIPLPPSPPPLPVPETPAPLREAMAARWNQVPATPISKLIASIQRGFEGDYDMITEENVGEHPRAEASAPPLTLEEVGVFEERVPKDDRHRDQRNENHRNEKVEERDENPLFVDTRPRKQKSERSKSHRGHQRKAHNATTVPSEARVPFKPRADNS